MASSPAPPDEAPDEAPDKEAAIKRNPHPDFAKVQAERKPFPADQSFEVFRTPDPEWKAGGGCNAGVAGIGEKDTIVIDPAGEDRGFVENYKLMISTVVPRPIALVSTLSANGACGNLAPFSCFQIANYDPPIFSLHFSGSPDAPNDTLRNLLETKEAVICTTSEWYAEAANMSSINTPPGVSEWPLSGLTPIASEKVAPPRIAEAVVAIEARHYSFQAFANKAGEKTGGLALLEGVNFHVRKDCINEERTIVDISKFKPIWRGGGITYGRLNQGFELLRPPAWRTIRDEENIRRLLEKKVDWRIEKLGEEID